MLAGMQDGKSQIPVNKELLTQNWPANWITCPKAPQKEYGVYFFRKKFYMKAKPKYFPVHVSADNRYRLFVNGVPVCAGPARGDLYNWFYESLDLAPYMIAGLNVISAQVWNMGKFMPVAQISNQTAFLLQGDSMNEDIVDTDQAWMVMQSQAHTPCSVDNAERLKAYMVVGPGDEMNGLYYPWGFQFADYNDSKWDKAEVICTASPVGRGTDNRWTLAQRTIPLMGEHLIRFEKIRRTTGLDEEVPIEFLQGIGPLTIPKYTTVSILLDQAYNTVAYPELVLSGGSNAKVKLTYAEGLFDEAGQKGNRNEVEGRHIEGNYDVFTADGGENRLYRPMWFRAYRYVQLDIRTLGEELVIQDIHSMRTGYPMVMKAGFKSNDASLQDIWKVGWRTVQNCAGESFYDTPYYEQLQYTGDSRIQALIALYTTGDDRLMRKCIVDFYHSRTPEGLTQGRYPSSRLQIIPTFSLFWVSMVHDYWMLRKDDAFVKKFLPAICEVMSWYEERIDEQKKMLGPLTWWNFVDWDNFNSWGTAPGAEKGNSSIVSMQLATTLNEASDLLRAFNNEHQAKLYSDLAKELTDHTYEQCFNTQKGMMANTPDQDTYSQHAGIWAVLSGAVNGPEAKMVMKNLLSADSIGKVTFFYRFYLTQALKKAGMADLYYSQLTPWRDMLKIGLTTFAEKPEPTRSDCHAWSASPNYDFLATICGIMPGSPGFAKVLIAPALGELKEVSGTMPHPQGMISVAFKRKGTEGLKATIILPEKLSGTLIWKEKSILLHGGTQNLEL